MPDAKNTKNILVHALKSLMVQRSFAKISVSDICEYCKMSRKSFYYHFQDKYDLMNWVFYTEFIATLQSPDPSDDWQLLLSICNYFYQEQSFYRNALSVSGQNSFQDYFIEILRPLLFVFIRDIFSDTENLEFFVSFYTDAFMSSIIRWLNEDHPMPPDVFADLLRKTISRSAESIRE